MSDQRSTQELMTEFLKYKKSYPQLNFEHERAFRESSAPNFGEISNNIMLLQSEYSPILLVENRWKKLSKIILFINKVVLKIFRPIIKFIFSKQEKINEQILALAYRNHYLEQKIDKLESVINEILIEKSSPKNIYYRNQNGEKKLEI